MTKYEQIQMQMNNLYAASKNARNADISAVWYGLYEKLEKKLLNMKIQEVSV